MSLFERLTDNATDRRTDTPTEQFVGVYQRRQYFGVRDPKNPETAWIAATADGVTEVRQ